MSEDSRSLRDEVARLEGALAAERRHAEQWRTIAEERRVALERLRQHPAIRVAFAVAQRVLPPLRRTRRRMHRVARMARRVASSAQGLPARLIAPIRERRLRQQVAALPAPPTMTRRVTVAIPTRDGRDRLARLLPALRATAGHDALEILVVDNGSGPRTRAFLAAQPDVRVLRSETNLSFSEANNLAARAATGDVLCLLNDDVEPLSIGWLPRMLAALEGDVAVVGAQLVYPRRPLLAGRTRDLGVQHRGVALEPVAGGVPRAVNLGAGEDPVVDGRVEDVAAATAACLVVDRAAYDAVGGLDEGYVYGSEDVDLCWRLRRAGHRAVVAHDAVLLHHEGATRLMDDPDERAHRQVANRRRLEDLHGPALTRAVALDRLSDRRILSRTPYRVAITVTRDLESAGYGDWYTAHDLGAALERLGWSVQYVERYRDAWYEQVADADVLLVLLDLCDIRRIAHPGLTTVAWVRNWTERWLSHPWFDDFDVVLASSVTSARLIREGSRHRPIVFPLATDPERFRPVGGDRRGVVLPANHWGEDRGVADLVGAVPELIVYGKGWDAVPAVRPRWKGHVSRAELPAVYQSAALVVDQTAEPTRPYGAVNARVFDALAAGALVASDNAEGAEELFDGALPTWQRPTDLATEVSAALNEPVKAGRRAMELRRTVLERHTWDARARRLRELLIERAHASSYVLKTGAPNRGVARTWGDWHLAEALGRELRALGHRVRVETANEWNASAGRSCDVAVHLKGRGRAARVPGQFFVLWVISHPEEVTVEECDEADLVLVASETYATEVAARTRTPVRVFLQATDHRRFRPRPAEGRFSHEVAFVGNSRFVRRRIVADAVTAGLQPAVYGANWDRHLDPGLICATFVPNEKLPVLYSSVKVLLNDHWDDMRRHGFVSNRVYDALACGAAVISDDLSPLRCLFGDAVTVYDGRPEDLAERVHTLVADPEERRRRGASGRASVLAAHTFAHRAAELQAVVQDVLRSPLNGP